MKVLHIIPQLNKGGAETLLVKLLQEWDKTQDVDYRVVVFRQGYWDMKIQSKIYFLDGNLAEAEKSQRLNDYVDDYKPDIIHTHLLEAEWTGQTIKGFVGKRISHWHGDYPIFRDARKFEFSKTWLQSLYSRNKLIKSFRKQQQQIIAISEASKSLLDKEIGLENIHLIQNPALFNPNVQGQKSMGSVCKLLSIGALAEHKNHEFLIRVMLQLKTKYPGQYLLRIIGEGPLKQQLEQQTANMQLDKSIEFLPFKEDLQEDFTWADMYIHAATREAGGMVMTEAMMFSLPVIATKSLGAISQIQDGINGYCVESEQEMVNRIVELASNANQYNSMSNEAVKLVKNRSLSQYSNQIIALYNSI